MHGLNPIRFLFANYGQFKMHQIHAKTIKPDLKIAPHEQLPVLYISGRRIQIASRTLYLLLYIYHYPMHNINSFFLADVLRRGETEKKNICRIRPPASQNLSHRPAVILFRNSSKFRSPAIFIPVKCFCKLQGILFAYFPHQDVRTEISSYWGLQTTDTSN